MQSSGNINNKVIRENFQAHWKDSNVDELNFSLVLDKLIGKYLDNLDGRSAHLVDVINHHFDDPNGRMVKIEKDISDIKDILEKVTNQIDGIESRLDQVEKKL